MPPELIAALVRLVVVVIGAIGTDIRTQAKLRAANAAQDAATEAYVLDMAKKERVEREKLSDRLDKALLDLATANATIESLKGRLDQANRLSADRDRLMGELSGKLSVMTTERDRLAERVKVLEDALRIKSETQADVQDENQQLKARVAELEAKMKQQDDEIERLNTRVKELEAELHQARNAQQNAAFQKYLTEQRAAGETAQPPDGGEA